MNKQTERLREKIARFCHDTDFACGMAEKPYVAESWGIAPEEVKQSYYKEADQILKTCKEVLIFRDGSEIELDEQGLADGRKEVTNE